jgi:hypothetical protein
MGHGHASVATAPGERPTLEKQKSPADPWIDEAQGV